MKGGGAFTGRSLFKAASCRVSDVTRLEDASLSYASLDGWEERGRLDDFLALARRCWRTRAYGDFWSYMLVAEGAVDLAAEPELALHDMAALDVIVRESGGRFTSLAGHDGPTGSNALASNGILHEAALGFLGSVDAPPGAPHGVTRGPTPRTASDVQADTGAATGAVSGATVSDIGARRRSQSQGMGSPPDEGPGLPPLGI
jgi:histidinol-phosphatase